MPRSLPDGSLFATIVGQGLLGENPNTISTSLGPTTFAAAAAFHNEMKAVARRATTHPTSGATCAALKPPRRNVLISRPGALGNGFAQIRVSGSSSLVHQLKMPWNVISKLGMLAHVRTASHVLTPPTPLGTVKVLSMKTGG